MFLVVVIATEFVPDDEAQTKIGELWGHYKDLLGARGDVAA
jgi:hypothetical protein